MRVSAHGRTKKTRARERIEGQGGREGGREGGRVGTRTCECWSSLAGEAQVLQRLFELDLVDELVVVGVEDLEEGREGGRGVE